MITNKGLDKYYKINKYFLSYKICKYKEVKENPSFFKHFFEFFFFGHLFLSIFEKYKKLFEKRLHPYHN
jgi:hypothetical protein